MTDEQRPSLGEYLKNERERRGLTIEQTSSATKIGLKVLKQLESDRYADLPALPFVRGFIRNYAKFLGIDGEKLLLDYAAFLDEHSRERPKRDVGHSGYAFERPEGEQSKKILWGVMAAMLVFGGAVVFVFKPSLKNKHHGHVDKLRASPTPSPVLEASASPSPSISPMAVVANASPAPSPVAVAAPTAIPSPSPATATAVVAVETPFVPPKVPLILASPTPKVVVAAGPSPVPPPSPSPVAVRPAEAAPVALGEDEDLKKDPLQSGTNYPPKEVKYKLIFRTKADVWVRYQCDNKKLMKFALKKGKILVLRGKSSVRFQTSNPDSITFQPMGGAEKLLSAVPSVFTYAGNPTLVFPPQDAEKIGDLFKVGPPLPHTDSPAPEEISLPQ